MLRIFADCTWCLLTWYFEPDSRVRTEQSTKHLTAGASRSNFGGGCLDEDRSWKVNKKSLQGVAVRALQVRSAGVI